MLLIVLLALTAIAFAYLAIERAQVDRRRAAVPLLIAVTGTRGKSSVTRTFAAVLRESGRRVLAKTTGTRAALILPDGSEEEIRRRGRPSIIEQKHVINKSAELGVDVAIIEVMSIHPENHLVETHQLLKPDTVLVTNFRVDHTAAMGETREAVAAVLGLDVPRGARVFVPERECLAGFRATVAERNGDLVVVPSGTASSLLGADSGSSGSRFEENLDLVCAAARSLGIDDHVIRRGVPLARRDSGALGIWRYRSAEYEDFCIVVNAFAANDPESTAVVQREVMAALDTGSERCVGLLSLRPDRGDRSLQWLEALRGGFLSQFNRLYVMGLHAPALVRRLRRLEDGARIEVLRQTRPSAIMQTVLSGSQADGGIVFGFGNFVGTGEALVEHWSAAGQRLEF